MGDRNGFGPAPHVELAQDVGHVDAGGALGDVSDSAIWRFEAP